MDRIAYRINDLARDIGLSRSKIYELIKAGQLQAVNIGGRTLVPATEAFRLLKGSSQ